MLGAVLVSQDTLTPLINQVAEKYGIEPALVKAIIKCESDWNINASRYEAHLNDSSWGLMQVLLATAKWMLGNNDLTITQLIQPQTNLEAGVKYLSYLKGRFPNSLMDVIASYNAGSPKKKADGSYINQAYVNKVYGYYVVYSTLDSIATPAGVSVGLIAAIAIGGVLLMKR